MRNTLFIILFLVGCIPLFAQLSIDEVSRQVEEHNTTLAAIRKQLDARMIENRTGIFPRGPDFEYAYFWSEPRAIGPKQNIALKQSFAFPTVYRQQSRIAHARNDQLAMEYAQYRAALVTEARFICIDLIYINTMLAEAMKRLDHANGLMQAYSRMLEAGETNLLEYNKVFLNQTTAARQADMLAIEQNHLLSELQRLNGGEPIAFDMSAFSHPPLPDDFEEWFAVSADDNPVIGWMLQEKEIREKEVALSKARNLPGFSAGYVSETLAHEQFHGWAVGLSIPLWENKNTIRLARANELATQEALSDQKIQTYNQLRSSYLTAASLSQTLSIYREQMDKTRHEELLERAFESGEMGLITYLQELSYYYQGVDLLLETERDLGRSLTELYRYSN